MEREFFEVDGTRLYVAFHLPGGRPRAGVLMCPPLLEERKGAGRVCVELAERLASLGIASLRFDYRGSGDSEGEQEQMSLDSCLADIAAALGRLRRRIERPVMLVGLRLGASLGTLAAERLEGIDALLLWQPVASGEDFYLLNLRRHMFRRSLIGAGGHAASGAAGGDAGADTVDLDGFVLRREFCEELRRIDLSRIEPPAPSKAILQLSFNREPQKALRDLARRWDAELKALVCEPFWSRIGHVDCSELIRTSAEWLAAQAG